ncbi:MAG TPA: radical SAM protein [Solirubrobacterales bacterium]|nr:radical SAM protein [Solirubrobacterales bacterium]
MRWDNLKAGSAGPATLPGLDRGTVTRTFDAPEAVGIRFHEIEARSAINDVGPMSYVDFRHTINPYRGCTHACKFCIWGGTRVLRGDGRTTAIADLRVGDEIYGTRIDGCYRRYVKTRVLNHWETKKPAFAIRLENGTELIASADHRFLSDRGWKYVTGAEQGASRRPHLTLSNRLLGIDTSRGPLDMGETPRPIRIVEIEPLGREIEMFDITTGTGDFIADGVISHNCFARPTHEYLDLNAREDFEREIIVKVNLPEVLRAELRRPSWKGELIALGTNTDPYQWVEGRYRITRAVWEALLEARNPCSVLTKSPLLLRDLDLFRKLNERTRFAASLSIPTLDEKAWRASEPATPNPRKRIEAVAALREAGIEAGVLIAPLMPGINDSPAQVNEILELCGEAGATSISGIALHLRGEVRSIFLDWLRQYRPDLVPRYEQLYAGGGNMEAEERRRLGAMVRRGGRARPRQPRRSGMPATPEEPEQPAPVAQRLF